MPPRSEPLLWVQLLSLGFLPLEALLALLILGGSDPGPMPALERLLAWSLGGLAPGLLLWYRPADVWSLLLVQTPLRARRPLQQRLSRLQDGTPLRLALALGGLASLPLLWWLDDHSASFVALSPLSGTPRLLALLAASLLLATMLWQWQQLIQSLWLLTRPAPLVAVAPAMGQSELESRRLSLGLPLLLPDPLRLEPVRVTPPRQKGAPVGATPSGNGTAERRAPISQTSEGALPETPLADSAAGRGGASVPAAIQPQQAGAEDGGDELNQQVS